MSRVIIILILFFSILPNSRGSSTAPVTCRRPEARPWTSSISSMSEAMNSCNPVDFCGSQTYARLWAQQEVMADLLVEQLKEWSIQPKTKMAIVDSGFSAAAGNLIYGENNWKPEIFSSTAAKTLNQTEDTDSNGHGTAIMGLAEGNFGVGIYPGGMTTVVKMGANGRRLLGDTNKNSRQACLDGSDIIIHSFGGVRDEIGRFPLEESHKDWLNELGQEGCIVVKSSGNSGFTRNGAKTDPLDNLHRVEALSPESYTEKYSTRGEFSAPGSRVFTILPEAKIGQVRTCSDQFGHQVDQVDGTSFSGPIYGEILQAASDVLLDGVNEPLTGKDNIKKNRLLAMIMNESSINPRSPGQVNGLKAIALAKARSDWQTKELPKPVEDTVTSKGRTELTEALKNMTQSQCQKKLPTCDHSEISSVNDSGEVKCSYKDCLNQHRKHLAMCPDPNPEVIQELVIQAFKMEDFNAAIRYELANYGNYPDAPKVIEELVRAVDSHKRSNQENPFAITDVSNLVSPMLSEGSILSLMGRFENSEDIVKYLPEVNNLKGDEILHRQLKTVGILEVLERPPSEKAYKALADYLLSEDLKTGELGDIRTGTYSVQRFFFPEENQGRSSYLSKEKTHELRMAAVEKKLWSPYGESYRAQEGFMDVLVLALEHDLEMLEALKDHPTYGEFRVYGGIHSDTGKEMREVILKLPEAQREKPIELAKYFLGLTDGN